MPCYQVQTCNVALNNADQELLDQALQHEGYQTNIHKKTGQLSFCKDQITGYYRDNQLQMQAPEGVKIDTDAIKRSYSERVVEKQAEKFRAKGWKLTRNGSEYTFTKPQQQQTVGFRR